MKLVEEGERTEIYTDFLYADFIKFMHLWIQCVWTVSFILYSTSQCSLSAFFYIVLVVFLAIIFFNSRL